PLPLATNALDACSADELFSRDRLRAGCGRVGSGCRRVGETARLEVHGHRVDRGVDAEGGQDDATLEPFEVGTQPRPGSPPRARRSWNMDIEDPLGAER